MVFFNLLSSASSSGGRSPRSPRWPPSGGSRGVPGWGTRGRVMWWCGDVGQGDSLFINVWCIHIVTYSYMYIPVHIDHVWIYFMNMYHVNVYITTYSICQSSYIILYLYLVGGLEHVLFFHIRIITIFFRGVAIPSTRYVSVYIT